MDTGLVQSGLFWLLLKLRTTLERCCGAAIDPPSSSRIALNVIFNFIPKVLLEGSKGMVTPGTAGMDSHGMCCWIPTLPLAAPSSQQEKGPWLSARALNPYKECSTRISTGEWSGKTVYHHQLPTWVHTNCLLFHNLCIQEKTHSSGSLCLWSTEMLSKRNSDIVWCLCKPGCQADTTFLACYSEPEPYSLLLNMFHPNTLRGLCSTVHSVGFPAPLFVCCWNIKQENLGNLCSHIC